MYLRTRWRAWRAKITPKLVRRSIAKMVTYKSVEFVGTTVVGYLVVNSLGDGGGGGLLIALGFAFLTDFALPAGYYVVHELLWEASPAEKHAELSGAVGTHEP